MKSLAKYRAKRDFSKTREPSGDAEVKKAKDSRFVIQKHAASHLHYDLRLELDGIFKFWAVTKGPSLSRTILWITETSKVPSRRGSTGVAP
jgi:bifunctional non-homologous end joining protein LigD